MTGTSGTLTTCLWFDTEGEEAAQFYCSLIPRSTVHGTTAYAQGTERAGQVMTVDFELDGRRYVALNGGPDLHFNEAVSFMISCASQDDVDRYWEALVADGGQEGPCGWLTDKYGLSWQVVPDELLELISGPDADVVARVTQAMYGMKKIEIAGLRAAADGA